jgi:hypothetical protein
MGSPSGATPLFTMKTIDQLMRMAGMLADLFRRRCGRCRYFKHDRWHSDYQSGFCVRNPPSIRQVNADHPEAPDAWPRVRSHHSVCGEFRRGRRISPFSR